MSVNRFEIMPPLLCAPPDALTSTCLERSRPSTVVVDIRDRWAAEDARAIAGEILRRRSHESVFRAMLLRIGMPGDTAGQEPLGRLLALRPDGFVLSGCGGAADIQKLDVMLRVAEAEQGIDAGSITILAEIGATPDFFLSVLSLRDVSQRLIGIMFDGSGLTQVTASEAFNDAAGRAGAPLLFARAAAVLKARQAELPCYDLLSEKYSSDEDLRRARGVSLADGFSAVIARSADQLAILAASI